MSHPRIAPAAALLLCTAAGAVAVHPASSQAQTGTPLLWTPTEYVLFDFVPVGGTGQRPVTIVNGGDAPLVIRSLEMVGPTPDDFKVAGDTCRSAPLAAAGGRCIVTVNFTPIATGTRAAQLKITQDSGCLNWINLAGSATGASAASTRSVGPNRAKAASACPTALPPVNVTQTTSSASSTLLLPAAKTCKSRRLIHLTLPKPKAGVKYRQFSALLNGKRVKFLKSGQFSTTVDLRGLPRGRFTLKLTIVTDTGQKITQTKHYVTCVKG
jgi:hypothetical protein